ncbi:MAG: phage portal protein [Bacteroidales bacterium]|nr:phage portal protein [Candidatus Equimonas faecalis]
MNTQTRTTLCEVFHKTDITTTEMQDAITEWYELYFDQNQPEDESNIQRLANVIVSKIYKAAFSEYTAESDNEFAKSVLDALGKVKKKTMQQTLIGSQAWLKPYIFDDKITFSVVTRDNVVVFGRDAENNLTDVATQEDTETDGKFYHLYENRYIGENGNLVIDSRLYESESRDKQGKRVPLDTLERYADLDDETEIPIQSIGLIGMSCPAENCVDGTDDPVSVYAAAVGLIHAINLNEAQLSGEFDRGESRIIVSGDLLKGSGTNRQLADNLFTALDDDPENVGFQIFSPQLREASFLARKAEYLRNIENLIGLKHGLLSDVNEMQKTAKEITSSEGDYNLTIIDFQEIWESTARECVKLCADLMTAYRKSSPKVEDEEIVINWGNGILYDRDKTWAEYMTLVSAGMLKPEIALAWYFNLPHSTPEDIEKIRTDYMPELMNMVAQPVE